MSITFHEQTKTFSLHTPNSSYLISIGEQNYLVHQYYGKRLSDDVTDLYRRGWHAAFYPDLPNTQEGFSPDLVPMEYSTFGCGDMRVSALEIRNADGNTATDIRYTAHRIKQGKEPIPGMPSLFLGDPAEAQTLEIDAVDCVTGALVTLYYTVFEQLDVITRRVKITNTGKAPLWLENVKSTCVDLHTSDYDLVHLWGAWGKERTVERRPLMHGIQTVSSRRGVSGHSHNPFAALAQREATEESGEVFGFNLVYSGNFSIHTEVDGENCARLVMGIQEEGFGWELRPGDCFDAPEAVMVYSDSGLGGMSRTFHRLYNRHLITPRWQMEKRPLLINSWEAAYFDFDEEKLYDFAVRAKEMGIEMLVMDDGWFGRRNDDRTSLGDWYVNEDKLHGGLKKLVDRVHALGMKFGIWFEPEMISPDSDFYRAHPDWCIHVPNRAQSISRWQYLLDISRKEVRDHVWAQMDKILSENSIDYVKWDFNRNFTEAGSAALDAQHQPELNHRFTLGTYDLQNRLVTNYPDILLENCSGGGGRFDPAMLYYAPQIWCSDNTDPIERLTIQFGTSLCYPAGTMGAHVSASRRTGVQTKGNIALWGTHGYELDPNRYTPEEKEIVKKQVADYHKYYDLIHQGELYRLVTPTDNPYWCAWEIVAADGSEALVTIVNMRQQPRNGRFLRLRGLHPKTKYRCEAPGSMYDGKVQYGDSWMYAGLNLFPAQKTDGSSEQYYFSAVDEEL